MWGAGPCALSIFKRFIFSTYVSRTSVDIFSHGSLWGVVFGVAFHPSLNCCGTHATILWLPIAYEPSEPNFNDSANLAKHLV